MEVMKLLKAIIILISFCFFNSSAVADQKLKEIEGSLSKLPPPVWLEDDQINFPIFLWRGSQYIRFRLNKAEKKLHKSAVFFMLDNAPNGKIVSWYSDSRLASGKVRVIHSYQISGGYCRTYQAYIQIRQKSRHMTNNACKYIGNDVWVFYK